MTDYIDLGECILTPVLDNLDDKIIPIETIFEGIKNSIDDFITDETTFLNIIACEETAVYFLSDYLKSLPLHIKCSVSIMKNYNIIPISGKLNYTEPMVVLHSGIDLNINDMLLRIFATMSYRFTTPTYITLFDHEYSQYPILPGIWAKSYTGYGKLDENYTNEYWNIKYD